MKKILKIALIGLSIFLFQCKDKDEDPNGGSADYKDQVMQGKINGADWTFVDGAAQYSPFSEFHRNSFAISFL